MISHLARAAGNRPGDAVGDQQPARVTVEMKAR
jgi:hypothetical protein